MTDKHGDSIIYIYLVGGEIVRKQFNVPGMSCQHCVMAITNSLKQLKGVNDVTVDLDKKTVDVEYDENTVTESAMINAIEEVGYDVE